MKMGPWRIGIDLGGTKIEIAVLDHNGQIQLRKRVATPQGHYEATLQAVANLITTVEHEIGQKASIGIATPGALSPATAVMKNANSTCLNGRPLDRDLEALLARPIRMANDADCFALSETIDGAAAGAHNVFGVILGTGVGGGIVINQQLIKGPNAIAGEWGHNPLPWPEDDERPGPSCYCGRFGCIETFLSGPGLSADHYRHTGKQTAVEDIVTQAATDADKAATLDRYSDRLARALAHVINILDPEVIVLGGGLSNVAQLYTTIPERWGQWIFSDHVATRLVPPHHGASSGVRGAAWLWPAM